MTRRIAWCGLVLLCCACRGRRPVLVTEIDLMGKAHEERLTRGFYPLQEKNHRWTKPGFALALDPPRTERPIYFELQFFLASELMDQARSVTRIAWVNGVEVGRQTYYGIGH